MPALSPRQITAHRLGLLLKALDALAAASARPLQNPAFAVPFTDNRAEQPLRMAKLQVKVWPSMGLRLPDRGLGSHAPIGSLHSGFDRGLPKCFRKRYGYSISYPARDSRLGSQELAFVRECLECCRFPEADGPILLWMAEPPI